MKNDTIASLATAQGRAGIGIVRISGDLVQEVAQLILGELPKPRYATYTNFFDNTHTVLDKGIAIYYKKPYSYTGEDVLEIQAHGGPILLDLLLKTALSVKGVRLAEPGEFTQQAFLNNKLDLTQAEAVIDLIEASSEQAARGAMRSLAGEFSHKINELLSKLIDLRMYIEASLDFPEEDIDILAEGDVKTRLTELVQVTQQIKASTKQGVLLQEGATVVIVGLPNAGKSSILNALTQRDSAIVTDIPGTTRDIIREDIYLDGLPVHIIDTAGLRESDDKIEQIGIERAIKALKQADHILYISDIANNLAEQEVIDSLNELIQLPNEHSIKSTVIYNKIDLVEEQPKVINHASLAGLSNLTATLYISAKDDQGIDLLREHLRKILGYNQLGEDTFTARRRHLDSLDRLIPHLTSALYNLDDLYLADMVAEELRLAQEELSSITGKFSADDLLTSIFSSFCIGK